MGLCLRAGRHNNISTRITTIVNKIIKILRALKLSLSGQAGPGHWLAELNCAAGSGDKYETLIVSVCVVKPLFTSMMASSNDAVLASANNMSRKATSES